MKSSVSVVCCGSQKSRISWRLPRCSYAQKICLQQCGYWLALCAVWGLAIFKPSLRVNETSPEQGRSACVGNQEWTRKITCERSWKMSPQKNRISALALPTPWLTWGRGTAIPHRALPAWKRYLPNCGTCAPIRYPSRWWTSSLILRHCLISVPKSWRAEARGERRTWINLPISSLASTVIPCTHSWTILRLHSKRKTVWTWVRCLPQRTVCKL